MQVPPIPAEDDLTSIPTEHVRDGPNLNRTVTERRKAAKRTLPWDLTADEIQLALPRPRLEEPVPTLSDEATTENTSHDTTVALPRPDTAVADTDHYHHHADSDHVTDMSSNAAATGQPHRWTPEDDLKLISALTNTPEKKWGKSDKIDWPVVAALIPGRTKRQCLNRWRNFLKYSVDQTNRRLGAWTEDEDSKLKNSVHMHGGNNWDAIAALVPGRMRNQCHHRWHALNPSIIQTSKCSEEEIKMLKHSVQMNRDKDWAAIATPLTSRTTKSCRDKWHEISKFSDEEIQETKRRRLEEPLPTSIDEDSTENTAHATAVALPPPDAATDHHHHAGADPIMDMHPNGRAAPHHWSLEEDAKLTDAVQNYSKKKQLGKKWEEIAALVPGRTDIQCNGRWHYIFSTINKETGNAGHWTPDEDKKLRDAVGAHSANGANDWEKIAALVPSRTKAQCRNRWRCLSVSKNKPKAVRARKWTEDEDEKLRDAVPTQGGKNWKAIAELVPTRTQNQCRNRWYGTLVSNIDPATALAGKWTTDEEKKLEDAVPAHGEKNWEEIAALVPGRTSKQCRSRWQNTLVSSTDPATALGKWTADEDRKLVDVVKAHGGKNWLAIAALMPGRTVNKCRSRWHMTLAPNIDPTNEWTPDEDRKFTNLVRAHGGKNWETIAALMPGRTIKQCRHRWYGTLVMCGSIGG
jgi:hypothetical protein